MSLASEVAYFGNKYHLSIPIINYYRVKTLFWYMKIIIFRMNRRLRYEVKSSTSYRITRRISKLTDEIKA